MVAEGISQSAMSNVMGVDENLVPVTETLTGHDGMEEECVNEKTNNNHSILGSTENRSQRLNRIIENTEEQVMGNSNTRKECAINEEGMLNEVIIDGMKYKLVQLEDPSEDASEKKRINEPKPTTSLSEALEEIFKIPVVKKKGGCHVSSLPRCISSEKCQSIMTEKEEKERRKKSVSRYVNRKNEPGRRRKNKLNWNQQN